MGDGERLGADAVVPHQQPACEPFVQPAAPVGERRLAALDHEDVDVAQQVWASALLATIKRRKP